MSKIVVVDDRPRERQYLVTLLKYAGHRVEEADNCVLQLKRMSTEVPDLVITDVVMPGMDGFEFVRHLRAQPHTQNVPVIFYPATFESEARSLVAQCGKAILLFKPAEPEAVLQAVNEQLGQKTELESAPGEHFDRAHLELITTKLHRKAEELESANAELADRARHLRLITDAVPVMIAFIDTEERYQFANRSYQHWTGLPPAEILGKSMGQILNPETYSKLRGYAARALQGETVCFEQWIRQPDSLERYVNLTYVPNRNSDGQVNGFVSVIEDRTTLKSGELQLRQANAGLQQANEALRQFAYAAAHDLREPSRQVALFAEMLSKAHRNKFDPEMRELLDHCKGSAYRMAALVKDLLLLSELSESLGRQQQISRTPAGDVLRDVLDDLNIALIEVGAEIVSAELPAVRMLPTHLSELFLNLIGNAIKFRSPARRLHVSVTASKSDHECVFSVQDNGIGFKPEYGEKIFELFKRLHGQEYPGTGIGLTVCRRITEAYCGRIWAESTPDVGSTFHFSVPSLADEQ